MCKLTRSNKFNSMPITNQYKDLLIQKICLSLAKTMIIMTDFLVCPSICLTVQ